MSSTLLESRELSRSARLPFAYTSASYLEGRGFSHLCSCGTRAKESAGTLLRLCSALQNRAVEHAALSFSWFSPCFHLFPFSYKRDVLRHTKKKTRCTWAYYVYHTFLVPMFRACFMRLDFVSVHGHAALDFVSLHGHAALFRFCF